MGFDAENIEWEAVGGGLSSMGSALADWFTTQDRIDAQNILAGESQEDIDKFYADLEAGEYDATMSPEMLKFFGIGRRATDITPTLSALSTSLESAQNDPRMMASSLDRLNTSGSQAIQNIQLADFEKAYASAGEEGKAYQALGQGNLDFTRGVYGQKLTQDQAAYAQAQQNIAALEATKAAAPYHFFAGLAGVGGGVAAGLAGGGAAGGAEVPGLDGYAIDGGKVPEFNGGGDIMSQILAAQGGEEGGVPPRQDLPGEESHEENPIDMVAPNGEKVGEATGGEIILNSEQTEAIEGAIAVIDQAVEAGQEPSMEDLLALYDITSETLSQPQFQDEQPPEAISPEQERMMMMLEGGQQQA